MLLWGAAAAAAASAALAAGMVREAFRVRLHQEEIVLPRLPAPFDGFRIFFISDIHRRAVHPSYVRMAAEAGGADLVLIGGDLRERGVPQSRIRANVRLLSGIGPAVMVFGNHDYDEGFELFARLLREEGITVLRNESRMIERDGRSIRIAGVDDVSTGRENLDAALSDRAVRPGRRPSCTILLSHDPLIAERMTAEQAGKVDLILAGHTHGGQIVMPFIGPLVPWKLRYVRGWHALPKRRTTGSAAHPRLFVSCGYGTSHLPLRFRAPAEAHLFTLRPRRRPR